MKDGMIGICRRPQRREKRMVTENSEPAVSFLFSRVEGVELFVELYFCTDQTFGNSSYLSTD